MELCTLAKQQPVSFALAMHRSIANFAAAAPSELPASTTSVEVDSRTMRMLFSRDITPASMRCI